MKTCGELDEFIPLINNLESVKRKGAIHWLVIFSTAAERHKKQRLNS